MYNCQPMSALRYVSFILGIGFLSLGLIISILSSFFYLDFSSGVQNFILMFVGVIFFWLSLEKVHPEGYKFFLIFLSLSLTVGIFFKTLGIIGFLITIFVLWFFRDPERNIPLNSNNIISPADGVICKIEKSRSPVEANIQSEFLKISVFMNVFNVHVNRAPVAGKIKEIIYVPGKFFNASLDKASEHNERNILIFENDKNEEIITVQIAGLIARRILSFVNRLDTLKIGERFGLIRFGSRVDVYVPTSYLPKVKLGEKVIAGETIIAN